MILWVLWLFSKSSIVTAKPVADVAASNGSEKVAGIVTVPMATCGGSLPNRLVREPAVVKKLWSPAANSLVN
jgi:hypothetical protein